MRLTKSIPEWVVKTDMPPRMVKQREDALEEMSAELKELELSGWEVGTEPWRPIYGNRETLGVFVIKKLPICVSLAVVDGGSIYLVWVGAMDGYEPVQEHPFLEDALNNVRLLVKRWS